MLSVDWLFTLMIVLFSQVFLLGIVLGVILGFMFLSVKFALEHFAFGGLLCGFSICCCLLWVMLICNAWLLIAGFVVAVC